jgi:putative transposase
MNRLYHSIGTSRQSLHQWLDKQLQEAEELALLRPIVEELRVDHPRMSARQMYRLIQPGTMGRDKFIAVCAEWGMLLERKPSLIRTTNSLGVTRFENLLVGLEVVRPNQVWSSDITYYRLAEGVCYLTFIMDIFSRRILGTSVSRTLRTVDTTIPALRQALQMRQGMSLDGLIFHSDGGGQYYCKEFRKLTEESGMLNSMCEEAWENPYSERVNGTIKNDYLIPWGVDNYPKVKVQLPRAIKLYDTVRLHSSLGHMTPKAFEEKWFSTMINNDQQVLSLPQTPSLKTRQQLQQQLNELDPLQEPVNVI